MKSFEVEIHDPREIDRACEMAIEEAEEHGEASVGLNHFHYSIVRGRGEKEKDLADKVSYNPDHPIEISRKDGGDSWVHSPESRCFIIALSDDHLESKKNTDYMRSWGRMLEGEIEEFIGSEKYNGPQIEPEYRKGDIYDAETGKQVVGLSGTFGEGEALFRMCMYDGKNHGYPFHDLVETDLEKSREESDMRDFREHYLPMNGLYDHIMESTTAEKVRLQGGVEAPEDNGDRDPRYCI